MRAVIDVGSNSVRLLLNDKGELRTDTISLIDCILTVKLMSDGSGRYILKLIDK